MNRGGKRPGAGRKRGSKSKLTVAQKRTLTELARDHTEDAVKTLADIMLNGRATASARVTAANSILDRGWGRAPQAITGPNGGPIQTVDLTKLSADDLTRLERIFGPLAGSGDDDAADQGGAGEAGL